MIDDEAAINPADWSKHFTLELDPLLVLHGREAQVLMCPEIMSTGFAGAESGRVRIGDQRRRIRPRPNGTLRDGWRALVQRS